MSAASADADDPAPEPFCRFGINVDRRNGYTIDDFDVVPLRAGGYMDYHADPDPSRPNGMRYMLRIKLRQLEGNSYDYRPTGEALAAAVAANPGAVWYIGNEPDRINLQDDMEPAAYAAAYHDLYHRIKGYDPTARVFPGSIVQATELRLRYLDLVLDAYRAEYGTLMPADGWSIHGFILNEVRSQWGAEIPPGIEDDTGLVIDVQQTDDFDIFVAQIERFRRWMYLRGYRNVPLYLSEYGVLMPKGLFRPDFDEGRVNLFMDRTFDYLLTATDDRYGLPHDENRLVQHFSWYSTHDQSFNGYLFDTNKGNERSLMGDNYAAYTSALEHDVDFYPARITTEPVGPVYASGVDAISIHAEIANAGNLLQASAAEVRFFAGDPAAGGTQIGETVQIDLPGCGESVVVKQSWSGVEAGVYAIYVDVQPVAPVIESDADNNSAGIVVFFSGFPQFFPFIE